MSVYSFLKTKVTSHAGKRSPDELIPGIRYPVYSFVQRESDYPNKTTQEYPITLVAFIQDPSSPSKYYVTLPGLYNDLPENYAKELNDAIVPGKAPVFVFYGKDKNRNDVLIHQHDEENDETRLQSYKMKEGAPKRKSESEDGPSSKKVATED